MSGHISQDELLAELTEVENDLANLRRTVADLHRQVGEEPDPEDRGALLASAEEQDDFIEQLEARQTDLLRQLGRP